MFVPETGVELKLFADKVRKLLNLDHDRFMNGYFISDHFGYLDFKQDDAKCVFQLIGSCHCIVNQELAIVIGQGGEEDSSPGFATYHSWFRGPGRGNPWTENL